MKVLFVSNLYPPSVVGGYERLCSDVATSFVARGHEVTVLTSCYGHNVSRHSGQIVHQALQLLIGESIYASFSGSPAQRDAINTANITTAQRVIDEARPNAIFCWNLYGLDRSLFDALLASGVPLVVMLTDNWLISMIEPEFLNRYFDAQVFAVSYGESFLAEVRTSYQEQMACAAIFGAAFMQDLYKQAGITFARSAVVYNGVVQPARPLTDFIDRTQLVREGLFNVLFAGRIVDVKGAHTAIAALSILSAARDANPRVRLTIVGDSRDLEYVAGLHKMAEELGCARDIEFRSPVREDALFALFQSYDAYVFPSLYEPFSLSLIHALAAGIPTVASDAGGNREIVRDGDTGLLFRRGNAGELARALHRLITSPDLRASLALRARAIAAEFTFERMVDGMQMFIATESGRAV